MTILDTYLDNRAKLIEGHAYDPSMERDACGVGAAASTASLPVVANEARIALLTTTAPSVWGMVTRAGLASVRLSPRCRPLAGAGSGTRRRLPAPS